MRRLQDMPTSVRAIPTGVTGTLRSTATEVTPMGFVRTRVSGDGQTRYIAG
jgi:hypothetical protein